MIFEMTENYGVVVPLMLACVLGYYISRVLRPSSIYAKAQSSKAAHAPQLTMARDLMRTDSATVHPGQSMREVEEVFARNRWPHVYVVDGERHFLGSIPMMDLAPLLKVTRDESAPWPPQLLRKEHPRVSDVTPLWQVLETFAHHPGERLPVVDADGRLLGHVTKTDLVLMLRERLAIG
jgi:CIC family chloride channel protein